MKYKNIVFDFGNVIGRFDGKAILSEFCPYEEELDYLSEIVYKRWAELDAGTLDYDSYINEVIDQVPEHLKDCIRRFATEWPRCTTLLPDTITFIHELKERNIPIYLLSNAPTYFAEYYEGNELLSQFDGILFSGPIRLAKPSPEIYSHFLRKFDLKAEESGLLEFCAAHHLPFFTYSAQELKQATGDFSPSAFVQSVTGVDNVCERSAVLHSGGKLLLSKQKGNGVTLAVAANPEIITLRF